MRKRAFVNLALVAVVTVLAIIAWRRPGLAPPAASQPIATLAADAVTTLTITRPDQPDILLAKDTGRWHMKAPYDAAADPNRIEMVLRVLTEKSAGALSVADAELARLGLAPAKASLGVNDLDIEFGDTHPLDARRYVKVGPAVHLVVDTVYYLLVSQAAEYLDKALIDPAAELVSIAAPDRTLTRGEKDWIDTSAAPLPPDAVKAMAAAWRDVRAYNVRSRGDSPTTGSVTLTFKDGSTRRFEIVGTDPSLVLARPDLGIEYEVDASEADTLFGRAKPAPAPAEGPADSNTPAQPPAAAPDPAAPDAAP